MWRTVGIGARTRFAPAVFNRAGVMRRPIGPPRIVSRDLDVDIARGGGLGVT